jgi:hypothetical protein
LPGFVTGHLAASSIVREEAAAETGLVGSADVAADGAASVPIGGAAAAAVAEELAGALGEHAARVMPKARRAAKGPIGRFISRSARFFITSPTSDRADRFRGAHMVILAAPAGTSRRPSVYQGRTSIARRISRCAVKLRSAYRFCRSP